MSFFKYHNYNTRNSAINFTYKDEAGIFHVGQKEKAGLITLLKENGGLRWNKEYSIPDAEITFKKIMPLSGNYVILGLIEQTIPFLLCINAEGDILWHRDFPTTPTQEDSLFAEAYGDRVYFSCFDLKYQNSYIIAVNIEGDTVFSKNIVESFRGAQIMVTGLSIYNETILISGNENGLGVVIKTDLDFIVTTSQYLYLPNGASVVANGVFYKNNKVYVSGLWNKAPLLILLDQYYGYLYKPNTGIKTDFIFGQDHFYMYNEKNEIARSTYNHVIEFTKQLNVTTSVIDQVDVDQLLIRGSADSQLYSGYIQNNINNCKSSPLQVSQPDIYELNMKRGGYAFRDIFLNIGMTDFKMTSSSYSNEDVCDTGGSSIDFNEFSGLQRPDFYLQAAGSTGKDSAEGIHLRWSFGGKLGENHLPKGNMASTAYNFNKPDDFVRIYRTPYVKSVFKLDFSVPPQLIDDSQKMWVYKSNNNNRIIYVYFKNKNIYTQVRQSINPLTSPLKFIEKYGNQIIEIKCNTDIFFAASVKVLNQQSNSSLDLEVLSVAEPNSASQQHLTYRKNYYGNEISSVHCNAENGKTIRFRADNCFAGVIDFEFYSDFIISRNQAQAWKLQGEFALTIEEDEAHTRLEPLPDTNPVHGKWLRYNDDAFVNIDNYKKKWQHSATGPLDRDIATMVEKYISLSNQQANPKAYETINFNFAPTASNPLVDITNNPPEDGETQVSNLDILNIASLDYHVARMLGLGHLDIKNDVLGKEFIYIAEYFTNKNVDINNSDKSYQLLSMSLPVSTGIERLSLPVNLMKLEKGMDSDNPNSSGLYNSEGYSHNGKYRYISIYNNPVPDYQINPVFFDSSYKFDASQFTNPVYAGLENRLVEPGGVDNYIWKKPELSHDTQYLNIDAVSNSLETLPIQIPDIYAPMYMHRQDKSGTYYYKGYGINWFSRAQRSDGELSIETNIKPTNRLLPPSGITAFNIQKEIPITFTSKDEQDRLKAIGDTDKTLVRLTFDHHIYQDEIGYSLPIDSGIPDSTYLSDPNSLFADDKEVFADDVEIYYRNYTPKIISAQAFHVSAHASNQLLAVIKTKNYLVPGSGQALPAPNTTQPLPQPSIQQETFKSEIPAGTTANDFIGGIFLMDSETYIINEITQGTDGLIFTVFKKAASAAIMSGTTPLIDQASLVLPAINPATEGLFNVTENMQNTPTWGVKNPNSLKVKIGTNDWGVHREIISSPQSSGTPQKYLEKSRGFWKNARIEKHYEEIDKFQNSLGTVILDPAVGRKVHLGVYKITFPGFKMAQHPQFSSNSNSVEWLNGIVRLFTIQNYNNGVPVESRSIFKVVRAENIGSGMDLVLYIYDENFIINENNVHRPIFEYDPLFAVDTGVSLPKAKPTDPIIGKNVLVNYYPSYKVYLYKNVENNLIADAILPPPDEDVRYSIFGLKAVDNDNMDMQGAKYKSKFSVPAVMFANRIIEPKKPRQPTGSKYATRPDKFGKSTYSFITEYDQKPYSAQFFRANDTLLLGALYEQETLREIKANLNALGGNEEEFFNDRWINFVDFEMLERDTSKEYELLPEIGPLKYRLPLPDSEQFILAINSFIDGHNKHYGYKKTDPNTKYVDALVNDDVRMSEIRSIIIPAVANQYGELRFGQFIKERIFNCFLPLTEVPMIYQHIHHLDLNNVTGHRPKNKKQNIRDASGYLLPATHADFDMAPMAAIYSQTPRHSTLFTDFTIDGASDNFYFYGVRELGNQMQMGEFSTFLGPIKLVNTNPAEPAKIMSLLPVVDNETLGTKAKVRIEVNPYPEVQKINKISVYRATNKLDAESILSMQHIKTVDIGDVEIDLINKSWVVYDEFDDLTNKPYGDLLFYRVVVSRKVEYSTTDYNVMPPASQVIVEQAPSLASKVTVSMLVENDNPPTPELRYHSEPVVSDSIDQVILSWDQMCYKGKYHLYKLNNQGNWKEVARINTDNQDPSKAGLYLFEETAEDWVLKENFDITVNEFFLPLDTLHMNPMQIKDSEGNILYHHFKVVAENTSNMFSTEEKILTIYKKDTWADIAGISSDGLDGMILQGTFIVRPNN